MGLLVESIKNELHNLASKGTFPRASYKAGLVSYEESDPATPSTIRIRERSSTFDLPIHNRQTGRREKTLWLFDLIVDFNQEVTSEPFEEELAKSPRVPADAEQNQITLELQSVSYEHPPAAGGSSRITFSVQATIGAL